jgi:hypothetical protein
MDRGDFSFLSRLNAALLRQLKLTKKELLCSQKTGEAEKERGETI